MKKLTAAAIATIAALSLAGCNTPEDRALGGAGLGALTGAAIGAAATGRAGGALAGAGWRIAAAPAARDRFGTLDRPRWRARLERCRNGRGGDWLLEWDHAAHRLHLPEPLACDAAAAGRSRA
ncbi:hypothetical protein MRF4_02940 [Methylobacterium radiotolerans]|uniref:hypothetical protein n=1 Tax=Methylobacterium radiotolerans TaxID=31998 RepID=UPI002F327EFC